jgi:bleomycin hydrolase
MNRRSVPIAAGWTLLVLALFVPVAPAQEMKSAETAAPRKFTTVREVWATPFKSQGETGTCWSFSTTSFLESEAHRLGRGDFELAPMFTVYHAYLEKAIRHVRSHGETPFRSGGLSHDVLAVIREYGAVPRDCYPGLPGDGPTYDHRELDAAAAGMMAGVLSAGKKTNLSGRWVDGRFQARWLDALRGVLDAYVGPSPASFEYDGHTCTPRDFAERVLRLPLDDYVEITAYSCLPKDGRGELLLPDNWLHYDRFYNVPLNDFLRIIDHALESGFSLVFDLHEADAEFKSPADYLLGHGESEGAPPTGQDERDSLLEDWRTEDVHLVHAIGLARDEGGRKFYKIKDSAGTGPGGTPRLYNKTYLSEDFVRTRVLFVMLHKDGLPQDIRTRLEIH